METENNSKAPNEAGLVDSGAGQEPEVQGERSTREGKSLNHAVGSNSSNALNVKQTKKISFSSNSSGNPNSLSIQKSIKKKTKQTKKAMENLQVYKPEFDPTIQRYAELSATYAMLNDEWIAAGCVITEPYTNKNGQTNDRKTGLYQSLENMRRELLDLENTLGLTPKGLKAIKKQEETESHQESGLLKALSMMSDVGGES